MVGAYKLATSVSMGFSSETLVKLNEEVSELIFSGGLGGRRRHRHSAVKYSVAGGVDGQSGAVVYSVVGGSDGQISAVAYSVEGAFMAVSYSDIGTLELEGVGVPGSE